MPDDTPIACSLDADGMQQRGRDFTALRAVDARQTARGITVLFAPEAEAAVQDFVRVERECCPFLTLDVTTTADAVRLDVSGPDDARPIVDAFLQLAQPRS